MVKNSILHSLKDNLFVFLLHGLNLLLDKNVLRNIVWLQINKQAEDHDTHLFEHLPNLHDE